MLNHIYDFCFYFNTKVSPEGFHFFTNVLKLKYEYYTFNFQIIISSDIPICAYVIMPAHLSIAKDYVITGSLSRGVWK